MRNGMEWKEANGFRSIMPFSLNNLHTEVRNPKKYVFNVFQILSGGRGR